MKVSVKQLKELGWSWPPHERVEANSIDANGMVDLHAIASQLARKCDYYRSEIEGNRSFAKQWGVTVDEVTDRADELGEGLVECGQALDAVYEIIGAVSADPPRRKTP